MYARSETWQRIVRQEFEMPAEKTVADFVVEHLKAWKVQRLFGYSGDGINGILGALNRAER